MKTGIRLFFTSALVASSLVFPAVANAAGNQEDPGALPATTTTDNGKRSDIETIVTTVKKYEALSPGGQRYFDATKARADHVPEEVLLAGDYFNRLSVAQGGDLGRDRIDIPIYGNWCGPGHSGPEDPIDWIDEACKTHDECYASKGYFNCDCDTDLVATLRARKHDAHGFGQKALVAGIIAWFDHSPCK